VVGSVQSGYRWVILVIGTVAQGAAAAYVVGVAAIAPALRAAYGLSLTELGVYLSAPTVGLVVALLPWGHVADQYGERLVMSAGLGSAAVILGLVPLAGRGVVVLAALALAGAAVGGVNAASGRAVLLWFPAQGRGLAMAIRQCALPLGAALAATVLPSLAAAGGVEIAFWSLAGFAALAAAAAALAIREPPGRPVRPSGGTGRIWGAARNRQLRRLCVVAGLLVFPQAAMTGLGVELLRDVTGRPAVEAAVALVTVHLCGAGLRLLVGWWSDQTGSRLPLLQGLALGMVAVFTLLPVILVTVETRLFVELAVVAAGALSVSWNVLAFIAAGELAPPGRTGMFLSIENIAIFGCTAVAVAAVAALADAAGWALAVGALTVPALAAATLLAYPAAAPGRQVEGRVVRRAA
jgi:sugar phosphate permease